MGTVGASLLPRHFASVAFLPFLKPPSVKHYSKSSRNWVKLIKRRRSTGWPTGFLEEVHRDGRNTDIEGRHSRTVH